MQNQKISQELFNLSEEDIKTSKMIYDNKVIKCLVAPYHSYKQLEEIIEYSENTYLFPENEMSGQQISSFISMVVKNEKIKNEVKIITKSQSIILDMIDCCVKILTERGDIVDCPVKTFCANIHDIRHCVLENKDHQISEEQKNKSREVINGLVDIINDYKNKDMLKEDFENLKFKINQIGEPIIRTRLLEMCRDLKVVEKKEEPNPEKNIEKSNKSLAVLEKELKAAVKMENFEKALTLKKEIDFLKSNQ